MGIALKYKWWKKINWRILVADIISGLMLLLFLYTSLSKFRDRNIFQFVMEQSSLLKPIGHILSWLVPSVEMILAVFLFIPATRIKGLYLSAILLFMFTVYLLYMITFNTGERICNCGGIISDLSWNKHIILNVGLIIGSIAGLKLYQYSATKTNKSPP